MYLSSILAVAVIGLATAAPIAGQDPQFGVFNVTNFSYTCSGKFCKWDFDVTDPSHFQYHPAITQTQHCTGNSTMKVFIPGSCTGPSKNKNLHINGYVAPNKKSGKTLLNLQYVRVPATANGFFSFYMGNTTVTDESLQPKNFEVYESSVVETS